MISLCLTNHFNLLQLKEYTNKVIIRVIGDNSLGQQFYRILGEYNEEWKSLINQLNMMQKDGGIEMITIDAMMICQICKHAFKEEEIFRYCCPSRFDDEKPRSILL